MLRGACKEHKQKRHVFRRRQSESPRRCLGTSMTVFRLMHMGLLSIGPQVRVSNQSQNPRPVTRLSIWPGNGRIWNNLCEWNSSSITTDQQGGLCRRSLIGRIQAKWFQGGACQI